MASDGLLMASDFFSLPPSSGGTRRQDARMLERSPQSTRGAQWAWRLWRQAQGVGGGRAAVGGEDTPCRICQGEQPKQVTRARLQREQKLIQGDETGKPL